MSLEVRTTDPEVAYLKACLNDLIGVVALPAIWRAGEPSHIVQTLLETVLRMLRLDFVYARLAERVDDALIELALRADYGGGRRQPGEILTWLKQCVGDDIGAGRPLTRKAVDGRDMAVLPVPLGVHAEIGIMVGMPSRGFPNAA